MGLGGVLRRRDGLVDIFAVRSLLLMARESN